MTSEANIAQYHSMPPNGSILPGNPVNPQQSQQSHQNQQQNPQLNQISQQNQQINQQSQQNAPPPPLLPLSSSFSGPASNTPPTNLLVLSNIPADLSKREAWLMFALVIDEVLSIEIKDYKVYVYFKSVNTCLTTGKLIDGKYIFGNDYAPIKVDYDGNSVLSSPQNLHSTGQGFAGLRLSSSNISPPNLNHPQLHHQPSNPQHATNGINGPPQQQNQPTSSGNQIPPSNANQLSISGPNNPLAGSGANQLPGGFDAFSKRQSIGNQRSRFVFSDPFSTVPGSATNPPQGPSSGPPSATGPVQGPPTSSGASIDFSDLSGKSILLMESHNDAREYENLVRDPWGSNSSASAGTSSNPGLPLTSAPQTPGVNTPFDWSSTSGGAPNASNASAPSNSNGSASTGSTGAAPGSDRRRTSSAFFTSNPAPLHPLTPQGQQPQQPPNLIGAQQPASTQSTAAILAASAAASSAPQGPTAAGLQPQQSQAPLSGSSIPSSVSKVSTPQAQQSQPQSQQPGQQVSSQSVQPSSQQPQPQATTPRQTSVGGSSKDVPDLSLLARVPPPANPADQNPPCNTLYVGNLPPDATEAELRALFSPQKGFRRLSFRTKNQSSGSGPNTAASSHNHGPMCFVEFEDVAHATRALAELYGRALPRPNGGNGKGGIRLSFSKNPLGVRGPGNPRRTSTNQIGGATTGAPTTQVPSGNGNAVGNYGYSNYHQK
ncbi:uncharacterized protein RJT20DRAFT_31296 [Scheffersomyces xylosifermentans]|uniref:uncharacterized protein n=1 Tax=Scheffersomyces xylosifermentans TaxID=1304137 RepID=UPI00315C8DDA